MKSVKILGPLQGIRKLRECTNWIFWAWLFVITTSLTAQANVQNNASNQHKGTFSHPDNLKAKLDTLAKQTKSQLLTRQHIITANKISRITLSPNGEYMAYLVREDKLQTRTQNTFYTAQGGLSALWVLHLKSQTAQKLMVSPKIRRYAWAASGKAIFAIAPNFVSFVAIPESLSHSANRIVQPKDKKNSARPVMLYALNSAHDEYFLRVNEKQPSAILVISRDPQTKTYSIFNIDETGTKTQIVQSKREILDVVLSKNNPYQAILLKEAQKAQSSIFDIRSLQTESILDLASHDAVLHCGMHDPCSMSGFDEAQNTLYMLTRMQKDVSGLYQFDLSTTNSTAQLIHRDPRRLFDIERIIYKQNQPFIAVYQTEAIAYYGLNKDAQNLLHWLKQTTQLDQARLTFTDNFSAMMLSDSASMSITQGMQIFTVENNALTPVELTAPDWQLYNQTNHKKQATSERFAIAYTVSDDMHQFGYVTLPRGYNASRLPLVVMPHGGPWSRSTTEYKPMADFIASRGYAVFEPNFRSSDGMGLNYLLSANKDFGKGRVQKDIIDGMRAVLGMGIGSADSLAIVGHSFGGFSTLAGLSFTPDLFAVGFAGAPPSDLSYSIAFLARKDFKNIRARRQIRFSELAVDIKDKQDRQRLSSQSPASHWQKVNKPLYIWAGKYDDRVDIKKVKVYAKQVFDNRQGKHTMLFSDPYSGHSPNNAMAMEAYFYLVEWALHKHLGGTIEAEISPPLRNYLQQYTVLPYKPQ